MIKRKQKIRYRTYEEAELQITKHLLPFFGNIQVKRIDDDLWDEFCDQAEFIPSLYHQAKVLKGFLRWCKKKKYIKAIPDFEIPEHQPEASRILKRAEIKSLFKNAKPGSNILLFISIALFMGLRRKEIVTLKWSNIDLENSHLTLSKELTKTKTSRTVTINPFVLALLRDRHGDNSSPWVFRNARDGRRHASESGFKTAWETLKKRAGIKGALTWNDLRATCEYFSHLRTDFTDTQREKYYGSSTQIQKRIYIPGLEADDVRGLEQVVDVPGLDSILIEKIQGHGENMGNGGEA